MPKATPNPSPMTDPRSLVVSLLVNGALLFGASWLALGVGRDERPEAKAWVLAAEVETTDNRAATESGGGDGEIGGRGVDVAPERARPAERVRDEVAEALLEEIAPKRPRADDLPRALPGPSTDGLGAVSGASGGGGGGTGTGAGGGTGNGLGPGTEFFGLRDRAGSYAYVIDCSGSMDTRAGSKPGRNILEFAKRELLASLDPLPVEARFGVVFYNDSATVFLDPAGRRDLMTASASNKARARAQVAEVPAVGGTDHMVALRAALAMKPEVIFFLTDADLMDRDDAQAIRREAGKTRILAIQLGNGYGRSQPLRDLAVETGGAYKFVDVRNLETIGR